VNVDTDREADELANIVQAIGEHERALLAAVLLDSRTLPVVREAFTATSPRSDRHRLQWQAIEDVADSGAEPDLVAVKTELLRSGHLEQAGGLAALTSLVDGLQRSANVASYALRLRELHGRLDGVRIAERIRSAATNGVNASELGTIFAREASQLARAMPAPEIASAVRLADVQAEPAEFVVRGLIPRLGVMWLHGLPNALKSFILNWLATEMLATTGPADLFGNPDLRILRPWRRVVFVSAEETAGRMRARWDMVLAGMALEPKDVQGTLLYVWPFSERGRFTIDRAEALLDSIGGDVDAVVLDSWTSLLPSTFEGRPVDWDGGEGNVPTRALVNRLRDLAARRRVLFMVVDHDGKNPTREGPRGASEKSNAADTIVHLERIQEGRFRLAVTKQRDGKAPWSFVVRADFGPGRLNIRHEQRPDTPVKGSQAIVLAFLRGGGSASVAGITKGTELSRSTVQSALTALEKVGMAEPSGEKDPKGSPLWNVPKGAEGVPNNE
jgi:hypothetical protein